MVDHNVSEPVRPSLSFGGFYAVQLEGCAWLGLAELESTDQIWTCFITFSQCSTSVRSQSFTRTNKYFGCYSHILSLCKLCSKPCSNNTWSGRVMVYVSFSWMMWINKTNLNQTNVQRLTKGKFPVFVKGLQNSFFNVSYNFSSPFIDRNKIRLFQFD